MLTRRIVDRVLSATVSPIAPVIACILAEAAVLRIGIDDLDEGYFVQQATRVLHGQIPFRDFETLYTPGLVYLHAGVFALLGEPSLVGARVLSLIARGGLGLLLVRLTQPLARRRWWAAAPALVLLLGFDDAPIRWEPHPGWLSTLFAVASVSCVNRRWLVAAGSAAGLSYLFKQNTGVFVLVAVLVWSRSRWKAPMAGFVAVTSLWLIPLVFAVGDLNRLGPLVGAVNQAGLLAPPEIGMVIPLACLVGGAWVIRRDSDQRLRWYLVAGAAIFLTEFPRMDTLHLAWSAPLLLVVGAVALDRLPPLFSIASLLGVVMLLAPTWSERVLYLTEPRAPVAGVEAPVATADEINAAVSDIRQRTSPGEPILVYPTSPLLYALADRPNPSRFDHLNPGAADARQINQIISDLAGVKVVVISDFWRAAWGGPGPNAALEEWIRNHYPREVGHHGSYRLLRPTYNRA